MMRGLSSLVMAMLFTISAWAGGNIAGKVTDEKTGEPMINATVLIKGTTIGTVTDLDGRFTLTVDAGQYSVEVKYMGYATKEIDDVAVKDGEASTLNIVIAPQKRNELNEVTVRSSFKKENIAALYATQKSSATIQDGISAEIIRRSPDRNTGEVLKRVSGTTVQDNKFIVVRGLNERYNVSLMNNAVLPSTEPDRKAFSFDMIPSNLIDNITVYKTATPDLPGDFAGGAVRVVTKDFPEKKLMEVNVGVAYNDQTTGKDFMTGRHKGKTDGLGFLDDSRDMPASFPDKNSYLNLPTDEQVAITKQFPDHFGYVNAGPALPNIAAQFTSGNTYRVGADKKDKFGYIFSLAYRNGRRANEGTRDDYDISKTQLYHYDNSFYTTNVNLGSILNLTYTHGRSKYSFKNFFNNEFQSKVTLRTGTNFERGAYDPLFIRSYGEEVTQNKLFTSGFEGVHTLGSDNKQRIDWNVSYGRSARNAPDQKITTFVQDTADQTNDHPYFIKLNNINSPALKDAGRVYGDLGENIYSAGLNYSTDYSLWGRNHKFKAGGLTTYRSRLVDLTALGYASTRFNGQTIYAEGGINFNTVWSPEQLDRYDPPVLLANILTNSIDYTGTSTLGAGYVMSENKFTDKLKGVFGVRSEYFQQVLTVGGSEEIKADLDFLPSLNLTYELNQKANLRFSGFQSVNRPEFREFAPYRYYDYDNDFIVGGEPNLERSKITNVDLRYELYPAAGEIISGSVFYKYFDNPIEQINQGNNTLTYTNVPSAKAYGAEIEIRKNLGFIAQGSVLDRFGFYLNAALIKGSVELPDKTAANSLLQGQSPYIINTGLNYASKNERTTMSLLYNRIGDRIRYRGQGFADIWEKGRNVIDFQVGQRMLKDHAEVKFTISDLLNSEQVYYYKYGEGKSFDNNTDKQIAQTTFGRTFALTLKYNF